MSDRRRRLPPRSRRLRIALASLGVLVAAAAIGGYIYDRNRTGNIYHPHARFVAQPTPTLPKTRGPARFDWPLYGYSKNHTRFFPASEHVRPPFRRLWVRNEHALLEFPPVLSGDHLYQLADDAVLSAIDSRSGKTFWTVPLGHLSASTPAVTSNTVYATVLSTGNRSAPGRIVALNSSTGAMRWQRSLPSASESSPLVDHGLVFFGSQSGTVYALDASTGAVRWTYHAEGAVKASPTLSGGVLYFGDYSGHVQAISERTGRRLWISELRRRAARQRHVLLHRRRRLRPRVPRQHRRPRVRLRRVQRTASTGRCRRAPTCTPRRPSRMRRGSGRPSTSDPTTAPSTRSMRARDTSTGASTRTGASPARPRSSGAPCTSRTSARTTHSASGSRPGGCCSSMDTGDFDPVISDGTDIYLTGQTGLYGARAALTASSCTSRPARMHARARSAPRRQPRPDAVSVSAVQPPGAGAHAPVAARERPVAACSARAPRSRPALSRVQRERVVAERRQPRPVRTAAASRRARGTRASARSRTPREVRQAGGDQPALARARGVELRHRAAPRSRPPARRSQRR